MNSLITFDGVQVGDELPVLALPPVDRTMLALFAGASGDHNRVHIDIDFARHAGLPDVFAHGMLGMAWLARVVTACVPPSRLRHLEARFQSITQLGHVLRCSARVVEKLEADGERRVRLSICSTNQHGQVTIAGTAVVALP